MWPSALEERPAASKVRFRPDLADSRRGRRRVEGGGSRGEEKGGPAVPDGRLDQG